MATLPYAVVQRKHKNKGSTEIRLSKHFYIRFRTNEKPPKLKYVKLKATDEKSANIEAIQAYAKEVSIYEPTCPRNSLKAYLRKNKWFSPTENPLFVESKNKVVGIKMGYHATKRLTFSLRYVFEELNDEIGKLPYQEIKNRDAKAFRARLLISKDKKGNIIPASRINRIFSALSDVYKYIKKNEDESLSNPFDKTALERIETPKPKTRFVFDKSAIQRMLNESLLKRCKNTEITVGEGTTRPFHYNQEWWLSFLDSPHYKLLSFMALTGLRRNEACALTKGAFDKRHGRIVKIRDAFKSVPSINRMKNWLDGHQEYQVIGPPKTERERTIILCDKAFYIIKPLLAACEKDTDFVFVTKRGEGNYRNLHHLYYGQYRPFYRAFFEVFCRNFNISIPDDETVSPHCLRTSLNSNLLKYDKTELKESWVAFYMGWVTETLTKTQAIHYTKYGQEEMWKVANAINLMYTGQEMLWKDYVSEESENNIKIAEATLLNESESRLSELEVKGLMFELLTKLANYDPNSDPKIFEERLSNGLIDKVKVENFLKNSESLFSNTERATQEKVNKEPFELGEDFTTLINHLEKLLKHFKED